MKKTTGLIFILILYFLFLALFFYLFLNQFQTTVMMGLFVFGLVGSFLMSGKFAVGSLRANYMLFRENREIYQLLKEKKQRGEFHQTSLYSWESDEFNSLYFYSPLGRHYLILSTALLNRGNEDEIKAHIDYHLTMKRSSYDSLLSSFLFSFHFFNLSLLGLLAYPFELILKFFFKDIQRQIQTLMTLIYAPVIIVSKNLVNFNDLSSWHSSDANGQHALVNSWFSLNEKILNHDIFEFNKFLSKSYKLKDVVHKS